MDVVKLLKNRKSCRAFLDKPIEEGILRQLLEAAICAPTSGGFQNYSIIKVTSPEKKSQIAERCRNQNFIGKAPVNLIFCMDLYREKRIAESFYGVPNLDYGYEGLLMVTADCSIAAQNLCIAAESFGLGSVCIGNVISSQEQISQILQLPEKVAPVLLVALGYPKSQGMLSGKYSSEIMVHEEVYEEKPIELLTEAFKQKYDGWKIKPRPETMEAIERVAEKNFGKEYSEKCRKIIWDQDWVDPLSYWNGYYYSTHESNMTDEEQWEFMKKKKLEFHK